ncbi:MAG: hypothetical protein JWP97_4184 [Labilithrix sp.]|nr:hypothetical protein [Labilithrix sp.]
MKRRFVVVGQRATASPDFSLLDVPGTSGRLDVLLRCLRASLLVSHGVRRDALVYLVLLGGPLAPRTLRIDGEHVRFVRPDDRMLALLVQKALQRGDPAAPHGVFVEIRAGLAIANGGLPEVLADLGPLTGRAYVLDEHGADVRELGASTLAPDPVFFVGDHLGFDAATAESLVSIEARGLRVGPVSLHAEDAITVLHNELDRAAPREGAAP